MGKFKFNVFCWGVWLFGLYVDGGMFWFWVLFLCWIVKSFGSVRLKLNLLLIIYCFSGFIFR